MSKKEKAIMILILAIVLVVVGGNWLLTNTHM